MQIFRYKDSHDYMLVDLSSSQMKQEGIMECLKTKEKNNPQSLEHDYVSWDYLENNCNLVSWKEIPEKWQNEFVKHFSLQEPVISNIRQVSSNQPSTEKAKKIKPSF